MGSSAIAGAMKPAMNKKPYIPGKIGARNPYALAERIYALQHPGEDPVAWVDNHENPIAWKSNRKQLMEIFHSVPRLKNIQYGELFDPSLRRFSPLYSVPFVIKIPPPVKKSSEKAGPAIKDPVKSPIPGPVKNPVKSLVKREGTVKKTRKSLLLSATPNATLIVQNYTPAKTAAAPCSDEGTHWATPAGCYYYRQLARSPADVIDDVVQGCAKDCYFMAALASTAWTKFGNFPPARSAALKPEYTIQFPGPNEAKTVDTTLVLDAANKPVFARPSKYAEIWPAIYEKAYGAFWPPCGQSSLPYTGNYPTRPRPHIPDFPYGDPLVPLQHLNGGSWEDTYYNTVEHKGTCFTEMEKAINYYGTSGITTKPMVAYSYYDAAEANTANGTDWITYDTELIVANHSYSILGTVKVDATQRYIVLRNPFGLLLGFDPDHFSDGDLYKNKWSPTQNFYRYLSADDGIFALKAELFECYFKTFGWVQ
jgi:hypothetical protein